jgi:Zn-dependent protease with chaperone function
MEWKKLTRLDSREYEHPLDQKALNALAGTPGLETFVKKFHQYGIERILKIQFTGSNLKVNQKNFPELHRTLQEVCDILYLANAPDLYIQSSGEINALTAGVEKPIIVINSGCVDMLTQTELMFVIGHEVGHIKSQHVLYHQMATILPIVGDVVDAATLGLGGLVSVGIEMALINWQRKSEFTADRAGLLACQDVAAATSALVKIAGLPQKYFNAFNVQDFITQAMEFEGYDIDKLGKVAKVLSLAGQTHPWTVMRAAEFFKWTESGEYEKILNRETPLAEKTPSENQANFCAKCGTKLKGNEAFCPTCGNKIQA